MKIKKSDITFQSKLKPLVIENLKYIVLHHIAFSSASAQMIHNWHINRGWLGAGYNYYVKKDGKVEELRGLNVGAHVLQYNTVSIGIAFEGDFSYEQMSTKQFEAGVEFIKYLKENVKQDLKIVGHKEINQTNCPELNFPLKRMKDAVNIKHWCDDIFSNLIKHGLKIHDKRFDDKITRAETFAVLNQLLEVLKK